jgi:hypothetical protein
MKGLTWLISRAWFVKYMGFLVWFYGWVIMGSLAHGLHLGLAF